MIKLLAFSVTFLFTNVVFSLILYQFYCKLKDKNVILPGALICFLGLGPFITTLLLYYLLILLPGMPSMFYVGFITFIFLGIFFYSMSQFVVVLNHVRHGWMKLKDDVLSIGSGFWAKIKIGFVLFFILSFVFNWMLNFTFKPIIGHDMLEYAIQARIFFEERMIRFVDHRFEADSLFYYVGLHGFSFPLLSTWERFVLDLFGVSGDHYLRSITGYYGMLIFALQYVWLAQKSRLMAFVTVLITYYTLGFYITVTEYHIDTYRIFSFTVSILLMIQIIIHGSRTYRILFAVFAGFQAFAHSLGAFIVLFDAAILFFYMNVPIPTRLKQLTEIALIVLALGFIHYILDIFWGTGWVFQNIKFY